MHSLDDRSTVYYPLHFKMLCSERRSHDIISIQCKSTLNNNIHSTLSWQIFCLITKYQNLLHITHLLYYNHSGSSNNWKYVCATISRAKNLQKGHAKNTIFEFCWKISSHQICNFNIIIILFDRISKRKN